MSRQDMLNYAKSYSPNAPVPESFLTMGEVVELYETINELEEGMRLMLSVRSDGEFARNTHPANVAQDIERGIDQHLPYMRDGVLVWQTAEFDIDALVDSTKKRSAELKAQIDERRRLIDEDWSKRRAIVSKGLLR